jgi:hypothetical protein
LEGYSEDVTQTSGIYHNGKVILDQSVDWPDGVPVEVICKNAEESQPDRCVDGSLWDDSPEGRLKWLAWFDSLEPVLTGRELENFDAFLRENREKQKEILHLWEARIDNLSK